MKRVFGIFEIFFDIIYLVSAFILGIILIRTNTSNTIGILAGIMAIILVCGDAFHLVPRIIVIRTGQEEKLGPALGIGKQITSISMTVFYLFLWQIGILYLSPIDIGLWSYLVYFLASVRIILCLLPQNKWQERFPPVNWGIYRNIPFFLLGILVSGLFFWHRDAMNGLNLMWLAIILSFGFYLPVVLWSNKVPKIGMLMLPKTCVYLWMLVMCLSL